MWAIHLHLCQQVGNLKYLFLSLHDTILYESFFGSVSAIWIAEKDFVVVVDAKRFRGAWYNTIPYPTIHHTIPYRTDMNHEFWGVRITYYLWKLEQVPYQLDSTMKKRGLDLFVNVGNFITLCWIPKKEFFLLPRLFEYFWKAYICCTIFFTLIDPPNEE